MKKLLGLLGAAGLVATTSATVVACGPKTEVSDVTLKSGALEQEFLVSSATIKSDGVITLKLEENSILTATVVEGTQKDGEVKIKISTTEEKITEKDVTETVQVMYKAKDAEAEVEPSQIASVSVKVEAKKITLVDLSGVTLEGFTATNDTTDEQVIAELIKVEGLEKLVAADVVITKTNATSENAGSIKITASKDSKLVKGEMSLVIAKLEAEAKKDLSTVDMSSFTATNNSTNEEVLTALNTASDLTLTEENDVTITKKDATITEAGSITITAKSGSTLVEGTIVLAIAQLTE
ncbi:lipoprotein [Spiroplasma monobiae]|uniref:Lipoprotein n=1 Tax=Spiroplasma monobiae MQ-1 TaxID=1336748 RepID=A0A2K9LUP5_SPISQ|nr:lipoprotein [Spiroplasma monobiae]AUM62769.1 hypothetical protein SMONO_v1c05200 [Spiroplasma monobiae MQ-1]